MAFTANYFHRVHEMTSLDSTVCEAGETITCLLCHCSIYELEEEALRRTLKRMDNTSPFLGKVIGVRQTQDMAMKAYKALTTFLQDTNVGAVLRNVIIWTLPTSIIYLFSFSFLLHLFSSFSLSPVQKSQRRHSTRFTSRPFFHIPHSLTQRAIWGNWEGCVKRIAANEPFKDSCAAPQWGENKSGAYAGTPLVWGSLLF